MVIGKARRLLGLINKFFINLSPLTFPHLYKAIVRPCLEYGNIIWGPTYKVDEDLIEKVQRKATKLVPSIRHLSYEERLQCLGLPSLKYRRFCGDMIMTYNLLYGHLDIDESLLNFLQDLGIQPDVTFIVSRRTVSFRVKGPRSVPFAYREYREKLIVELELFQKQGIIMPVTEVTGWCTPIMVTPKMDMDHIRIYVDLPRLNNYVRREVITAYTIKSRHRHCYIRSKTFHSIGCNKAVSSIFIRGRKSQTYNLHYIIRLLQIPKSTIQSHL